MSRTRPRVVLILLVLILVVASILSSLLTYWVGASDVPTGTPSDGEAGGILPTGGQRSTVSWHSVYPNRQRMQNNCTPG